MEQVAAVCYRIVQDSSEFLLVRTTGGRWTFPKGHVDRGEEKWFAAQREAFEEAGVPGDIEHEPLTTYLHEKKEWKGQGLEIRVQAFLLRVTKLQPPEEKQRSPTWFSAAQVAEALAEGRKFKYAEEFRRVSGGGHQTHKSDAQLTVIACLFCSSGDPLTNSSFRLSPLMPQVPIVDLPLPSAPSTTNTHPLTQVVLTFPFR